MGEMNFTVYDHTLERSSFQVNAADLTAANIDSQLTKLNNMQAALVGVTLGELTSQSYIAKRSPLGPIVRAADPDAQRECKAMMLFYDSVTFEPGKREIPCVDLNTFNGTPGVFYDAGNPLDSTAEWQAFVSNFTSCEVGPGGNPVVVSQIYHIGKAT